MSTHSVSALLNRLIETCRDGEEGFRTAAGAVHNPDLKTLFRSLSLQRHEFIDELQAIVRDLREAPETNGSVAGVLHRGWIRLKAVVCSGDEAAILAECECGEESAVAEYRDVMESGELPAEIGNVLRLHLMGVGGALQQIHEVRGHFKSMVG